VLSVGTFILCKFNTASPGRSGTEQFFVVSKGGDKVELSGSV